MMPLYFYILLGAVIVPLWFSIFRIDFVKNWKNFTISTTIVAGVFLIWDALFTSLGIWGFNDDYCLGVYIFNMPIEEWLFFMVIPFCSLFTHFAFIHSFPNIQLKKKTTFYISILLTLLAALLIITNYSKAYTVVNFSFLLIILLLGIIYKLKLLQQFYISFVIILFPFFIVNGILTGAITDAPIISYNDLENLGIKLYTIPVEDIGYAFTMLFGNLMIFDILNKQ